ncbi:MAG TPA: 2-phospho-L-lactate transferase CofD family protein [bacterium]|nr:2-phospho-L-lactate transferase CofD family protein [bacterium]
MGKPTGLVFISGGSALNSLASTLAEKGLFSTHIISAFDNGGSSRFLREAFNCIAIGDIRNRLCAIGGHGSQHSKNILTLFRKRLSENKPQVVLKNTVESLASGNSELPSDVPAEILHEITLSLDALLTNIPKQFDWRNGSIGNFILIGRYLLERNWENVLNWAHKIIGACGEVVPITTNGAHLGAVLKNGRKVLGQSTLTDQKRPIESPIDKIQLYRSDKNYAQYARAVPFPHALESINSASVIIYSWGSFYTSILPAFLVDDVSEAVVNRSIPKVLLLNPFRDAELIGMTPFDVYSTLERYILPEQATDTVQSAVTHVIALKPEKHHIDSFYNSSSLDKMRKQGVEISTINCEGLPQRQQIEEVIKLISDLAGNNNTHSQGAPQ